MSNTNANFDMTGILLGQDVRKRKTPQEIDWPPESPDSWYHLS
jgi:hypothetical protein